MRRSGRYPRGLPSRTLGLVCVFGLAGCGGAPSPEPEASAASEEIRTLPAAEEFVRGGLLSPGGSRAAIERLLGPPEGVAVEAVPNRHLPGVTDSILTLRYADLVAGIHRPGPGGELVSSIEVTSNRHLAYPVIGATRDQVTEGFGPPHESTDSTLTYRCTTCIAGDDPVRLTFAGDRVRSVRFDFYVD